MKKDDYVSVGGMTRINQYDIMQTEMKAFAKQKGFKNLKEMVNSVEMRYQHIQTQLNGILVCKLEIMQEFVSKVDSNYTVVMNNGVPKIVEVVNEPVN